MNIVQAMNDPALFGRHFRGDSWTAWRAFLAALFGLPIDDEQARAIYAECTGRTPPEGEGAPSIFAALVVGRRGGKSLILALIAVYLATFRDYAEHLAPGEVGTVAILAADRRQARSIFRYVTGLLEAVPMLAEMIEEQTSETITLNTRVVLEIQTASFRVTRGYTFVAVLADEVAFWRTEDSVNPDREIIAALRPGLATIPGSMLLIASSPYRKRGVLWDQFAKNFGRDDARTLVWRAPTRTMNPRLDARIIEEAYEEDAESAAAEYGAEFRSDLSDFVTRAVIEAATPAGRVEIAPMASQNYVAFVDPSGGSADSMTLAIGHREGERAILDAVREVKPPFSPEMVTSDFAALMKEYRVRKVTGDRYAGEWPRERFRVHGIHYELSADPKSEIYLGFLPLLNSGRVQLLAVPRLASQLLGLERRTGRSGRDSIDHGPGAHDDVANAAAGALVLAAAAARSQRARRITVDFMAR